MLSPFTIQPSPAARQAAAQVQDKVHAYMREHPESELHQCGKMFGVLVVTSEGVNELTNERYLAAFSAQLDGSYYHEGFVPPVWDKGERSETNGERMIPIGHSREESQRLQRLLFANYTMLNGRGESKNLLDIFASEKPILSKEEYFNKLKIKNHELKMPPSGAGECCAPKLLQYAFAHHLTPLALAEFWVGAPSRTEIRREGAFYPPCSGKCVPILRHMLQGLDIEASPETRHAEALCRQIEVLYEDDYLMVVNKPSGLLSVPGKTDEISVERYFHASPFHYPFVKAAHRLDQDTSGILVLAKTPEVYTALQAYFQRRDILKRYEAVLLPNDEMSRLSLNDGMVNLPLLPNPFDRPRQMVDLEHGKPAVTRYAIRERRPDGTVFVDFYPLTGRTHQLRVHAAHPDGLNAPIVGDRLYGPVTNDSSPKSNRLMLHAAEIRFVHPVTQEEMHFCTPSLF